MRVTEGRVEFDAPDARDGASEGRGDGVFYNPTQELNRDVTVAVLRAYADREPRAETYLDAMTATGVRALRAAAGGWDATAADTDADAVSLARENAAHNDMDVTVVDRDANALMHESTTVFDVVDIDPFGTPVPFADAAFANARDLVCVTATDTAPLCGAHFESGVRSYAAVPRNTDYHPEMGLRILLSAMVRTAARYDTAARPICSHVSRHYARTYLELDGRATRADDCIDELGYVHHCEDCLARESGVGLIADPPADCPACGSDRLVTAGPLWLGSIRDREFVAAVRRELTGDMGEATRADRMLRTLEAELDEPTHYDQHRLCKEWTRSAPAMDDFLDDLRAAGFEASRAHYGGTTFKTDAGVTEIRDATAD
ncbi:tRNA (guanine(26)-N(2))-dimethyltransferase [Haloplanus sp.]|uniref:tRNA (guanine(26)-N(2))-dimethyltransferase n=1 Tax=Haloplanus sp. TaxID=1961696 RepID=UPI00262C7E53|nr:tRNA (guanine(26)-N(2))-dimethyltransferase [Haloplanus sp.]